MPELGLSGSVRGARGNPRSYRDKCGRLNPRTGHIMKGTNFAQMGKTRPFNLIHEACCRSGTIINK